MLQLENISKTYITGDSDVKALKNVSIALRGSEFVSVLGPSGCGKTTLLNIIGGLDRYTSGDLVIDGRSTKEYRDGDWDAYRNQKIGFVFQTYNLISHQSVLSNVELALTISGISKQERRKRAREALKNVGLENQIRKKPNQLSGGQMQRVAIARALVNNPKILLADEPTGALDSVTSIQVMELLKEISKDRLVVMVTHNRELAEKYSTRIVNLLDGEITGDSMPYSGEELERDAGSLPKTEKRRKKAMPFFTATALSFSNLMTKRARTLLTSFAGSIGIIGIALILALSTGARAYIDGVQKDTLSSYPIMIHEEESDLGTLITSMTEMRGGKPSGDHGDDAVYSNPQMYELFNSLFAAETTTNNLTDFKTYLDREMDPDTSTTGLYSYASAVRYGYGVSLNCYVKDVDGEYRNCAISEAFKIASDSSGSGQFYNMLSSRMSTLQLWEEMLPGNDGDLISDIVYDQYDLMYGRWPQEAHEIVLILDKNNEISDLGFYALGLIGDDEIKDIISAAANADEIEISDRSISYSDVCGITFKMVLESDYYADRDGDGIWTDIRDDSAMMDLIVNGADDLHIVGVIRPNEDSAAQSLTTTFGYTSALTRLVLDECAAGGAATAQSDPENENRDILTGLPFVLTEEEELTDEEKAAHIKSHFESLTDKEKTELYTEILSTPSQEELDKTVDGYMEQYDTREKMEELAASSYGMSIETIRGYLDGYTDEELRDMMRGQVVSVIEAGYASAAKEKVEGIMYSPSESELRSIADGIISRLTTPQMKMGYITADWSANTAMRPEAIAAYLAGLTPEQFEQALYSVAGKDAAKAYSGMAHGDANSAYAKAAAAFDAVYTNENDTATLADYYEKYMPSAVSGSSYAENMRLFGAVDADSPKTIYIYASAFENKDRISDIISQYNDGVAEDDAIAYTDYMALLMSGVTNIINAISYVLIAFVAISLVVSSIMIGIITYISVLERTKEIGVLRAVGASKRDISMVFNAETLIVGLCSGIFGIAFSLLGCIPINLIIHHLSGITSINAFIEPLHCVILVVISMLLTLIAGLIPSGMAAKKDPVVALRTE